MPKLRTYPHRKHLGLDEETNRALREACEEDQVDESTRCRAYIRDGLRRDGFIVVAKKTA